MCTRATGVSSRSSLVGSLASSRRVSGDLTWMLWGGRRGYVPVGGSKGPDGVAIVLVGLLIVDALDPFGVPWAVSALWRGRLARLASCGLAIDTTWPPVVY